MRSLLIVWSLLLVFLSSCGNAEKKKEEKSGEENVIEEKAREEDRRVILFFGNSLTAGYGLEPDEAFPALIQNKIDSLDLNYEVVNAGLSGETTASGKNRVEWVLNQEVDVFVLELGANDGLRGIPLEETRRNLQEIIDTVKEKNPEAEIVLAGMQIPPNMGTEYTSEFRNIFPELAKENDILLIPFLLEGVAGIPELNQGDGIHPTVEGQKIVAGNVWETLKPALIR
ncbi:arylesterase [Gramella jeungdoensis]|uniref:Arylesterase n=1 Tax=Gramella jeungdoensis TaxID=708091 RepID=A0ABT0Z3X1_9FLAO|nr:arylesterase [Gramella jeungdoensis]MCM8570431.1 arylesterase [Gramella jeungdoensis]